MSIDFDEVKRQLLGISEQLMMDWYPDGKRQGKEYVVGDVTGNPGTSLSVNLEEGVWNDFAGEESGSDLVALYAAKEGIGQVEAAKVLIEKYALSGDAEERTKIKKWTKHTNTIGIPPHDAPDPVFGSPEATWRYLNTDGTVLFHIARYIDKTGKRGKYYRPFSWDQQIGDWANRAFPVPRPMYGLEKLAANPNWRVLITEGEKACDAARTLVGHRIVCMTWPGGSNALNKVDWKPLRGRKVTLFPDADEPGRTCMQKLAFILASIGCNVTLIDVSDIRREGWDLADAVADGWTEKKLSTWARERARSYTDLVTKPSGVEIQHPAGGTRKVYEDSREVWETLGLQVNSNGKPIVNKENVRTALERCGNTVPTIWYDEFYQTYRIRDKDGKERELIDADILAVQSLVQSDLGMPTVGKGIVADALEEYGWRNKRNSAQELIKSMDWDGRERIGNFFPKVVGCQDTEYARSVSKNFWVGMIARVFSPGCKCDNMVILEGKQGIKKTMLLDTIAGEFFGEISQRVFDPREFVMAMTGHMLVEMGELHAFKTSDIEALKQFLTQKVDTVRRPYERYAKRIGRSAIFVGTTNLDNYITDHTGGRRFWPIRCTTIDIEYVKRNRDSLFAEAYRCYKDGHLWYEVPLEAAAAEQEERRSRDPWEDVISANISLLGNETTIQEIAKRLFEIDAGRLDYGKARRIGKALRLMGWKRARARTNGIQGYVWRAPTWQASLDEF